MADRDTAGKAFVNGENRFRLLFEKSVDAQVLFERKAFIHCNDTVLQMMWPSLKEDLLGRHTNEFSPRRSQTVAHPWIRLTRACGDRSLTWWTLPIETEVGKGTAIEPPLEDGSRSSKE